MWWKIISAILSKNNSPAWNKIGSLVNNIIGSTASQYANSARSTYSGAVDNSGMYGNWGGF